MSDSWFVQQRQEWIAETIRVFGFINREHLEIKFGISTPQASTDLKKFQQERPAEIVYNTGTKRYERRRKWKTSKRGASVETETAAN